METVLVTGHAGFIGHHLAYALKKNYKVIGVDNLIGGIPDYPYGVDRFHQIEVAEITPKHLRDVKYVFHLAALPRVPFSIEQPKLTHINNVNATLDLLIKCRDAGVKKFIYSSSSSAYGSGSLDALREDGPTNPLSPYAVQKLAGEHYTTVFNNIYGMPTASLRYFNVFGDEQREDNPYTGVITKFFKLAREGKPLTVYGDGLQSRDFTFVGDVVKANIMVAESDATGVFNVGTGKSTTVLEIARAISSNVVREPERLGDPKFSLADNTKLRSLGWSPKTEVLSWIQSKKNA